MKPGTTVNLRNTKINIQRKKIVTSGDYCGMVAAVVVIGAVILERWR
ncbi:unnamed protein product [Brassica napus]|uniref:(rape) hypothetical protein n=1 Tax=Brassica napus TaxID=3708 RepID=A0A816IYL2_BRANA|nr:unnamed protein product [Brassica napus]